MLAAPESRLRRRKTKRASGEYRVEALPETPQKAGRSLGGSAEAAWPSLRASRELGREYIGSLKQLLLTRAVQDGDPGSVPKA
ncbi:MAG: hypothetical protein AMXMBFR7_38490 [Planctomycetota bacterium]